MYGVNVNIVGQSRKAFGLGSDIGHLEGVEYFNLWIYYPLIKALKGRSTDKILFFSLCLTLMLLQVLEPNIYTYMPQILHPIYNSTRRDVELCMTDSRSSSSSSSHISLFVPLKRPTPSRPAV